MYRLIDEIPTPDRVTPRFIDNLNITVECRVCHEWYDTPEPVYDNFDCQLCESVMALTIVRYDF